MTSNNVVRFPKNSSRSNDKKDLDESLDENKTRFADNLVDHYGTQLLGKLATHGITIDNPIFFFDYMFAVEALRAAVHRSLDIKHPMHELLDSHDTFKYFVVPPPDVTKDS